jgi:tRNA (cmo5U34)-methyltransferase
MLAVRYPNWSPDGRRIIFAAFNEKTGRGGIYVVDTPLPGGTRMNRDEGETHRDDGTALPDDWDPDGYLEAIRAEVPLYEQLQEEVVRATTAIQAGTILELGTGTGETARRLLAAHPHALLLGLDGSGQMLRSARASLPQDRVELRSQRLEDELPSGLFDLVVSVLAVHHLDDIGKADLFRRVARVLVPDGVFVLGDLVVPELAQDAVTPVDGVFDRPSSAAEQLGWLHDAGLHARAVWLDKDLGVLAARRDSRGWWP